jgi:gamma-tubulin complex component 3
MPLSAIFTSSIMSKYLRLFNLLWRIKRVEHSLSNTWRKQTNAAHLSRSRKNAKIVHRSHILRNEMLHFISNLEYYILFEVIESSWAGLLSNLKSSKDLDLLIESHNNYLDNILEKCLLSSPDLSEDLSSLLETVLKFTKNQETFYVYALQDASDTQSKLLATKEQEISDRHSLKQSGKNNNNNSTVMELPRDWHVQLYSIGAEYTNQFNSFMNKLGKHSDVKLQSLQFRLDFNDFYDKRKQSN